MPIVINVAMHNILSLVIWVWNLTFCVSIYYTQTFVITFFSRLLMAYSQVVVWSMISFQTNIHMLLQAIFPAAYNAYIFCFLKELSQI